MPRFRILMVASTFPPHTLGGGPRLAGWLREALVGAGHDLEILTARPPAPIAPDTPGVIRRLEPMGSWSEGRGTSWRDRWSQCGKFLHDRSTVRSVIREFRPDLLLPSPLFNLSQAHWIAAEEERVPRIYYPVSAYSSEAHPRTWGRLERAAFRLRGWPSPRTPDWSRLAGLAAPSEFLLEDYRRNGFSEMPGRVIPLGVPTRVFRPASSDEGPRGEIFRILWFSRITRGKGYDTALEAFTELARAAPGKFRLTLAGFAHPEDEEILQREIAERGLTDRVERRHIALDDDEGLVRCYQEHDLYWLTTRLPEALSLSLLEALSCGLPVAATRVGGNIGTIEAAGAMGVEPGNASELVRITAALESDRPKLRFLSAAGRAYVERSHSLESMARGFEDFFGDVLRLRAS